MQQLTESINFDALDEGHAFQCTIHAVFVDFNPNCLTAQKLKKKIGRGGSARKDVKHKDSKPWRLAGSGRNHRKGQGRTHREQ